MVVRIQAKIFWVVTPCSIVVGYQCFGGLFCLHLKGEVNGMGKGWRQRQQGPPKCWYIIATLHGITTQKTWTRLEQKTVHRHSPVIWKLLLLPTSVMLLVLTSSVWLWLPFLPVLRCCSLLLSSAVSKLATLPGLTPGPGQLPRLVLDFTSLGSRGGNWSKLRFKLPPPQLLPPFPLQFASLSLSCSVDEPQLRANRFLMATPLVVAQVCELPPPLPRSLANVKTSMSQRTPFQATFNCDWKSCSWARRSFAAATSDDEKA